MSIPELKEINRIIGCYMILENIKTLFREEWRMKKIRVEHSICGAQIAKKIYEKPFLALAYLMEYCIAGHHSGIPDGGVQNGRPDSLNTRLQREMEDYSAYQEELEIPQIDLQKVINFFAQDIKNDIDFLIDKFAFLTRYCFFLSGRCRFRRHCKVLRRWNFTRGSEDKFSELPWKSKSKTAIFSSWDWTSESQSTFTEAGIW